MSSKSPLFTLGAVAVFGAALLIANMSNESALPQSVKPSAASASASASPGSLPPQSPTQPPLEAFPAFMNLAPVIGQSPAGRIHEHCRALAAPAAAM